MAAKLFSDKTIVELFTLHETNNSPIADISEFRDDIMRFSYVNRIIKRYQETGVLNHQLLLNHIIILYNVFGYRVSDLLVESSDSTNISEIYGVLTYLERMPLNYPNYIPDQKIIEDLNRLVGS
jgi:hypothetical protein